MSEKQDAGRRRFLGVVGGTVAGLVVGGVIGSVATSAAGGQQVRTVTETRTVTQTAAQETVTKTATVTAPGAGEGFVYPYSAEERAVRAARELVRQGKLTQNKLVIMTPAGATVNWSWSFPLWEQLTGIKVESFEVPYGESYAKILPEAAAKTGSWHLTCAPPAEVIGDFEDLGLTADLTEYVRKYDPNYESVGIDPANLLNADASPPHPLCGSIGNVLGRRYSFVADGDVWCMLVRMDILKNESINNRFAQQTGNPIPHPNLWDWKLYNQLVKFVDSLNLVTAGNRTRGAWNYRERRYSNFDWALRYFPRGGKYFTDDIKPDFNNQKAVEALKEQQEITSSMDDIVFSGDFTEQYTDVPAGKAFVSLQWPSLAKYVNDPTFSKVVGLIEQFHVPHHIHPNGERIYVSGYFGGVLAFMNKYAPDQELAYLFLQWITGPKNSTVVISKPGWFDPFRYGHFVHPAIVKIYAPSLLNLLDNYDNAAPPFTVPRSFVLLDKLRAQFNPFYLGQQSAEDALKKAEEEWKSILDTIQSEGKLPKLRDQWNFQKQFYPPTYRRMVGWA
ncbi:MAG: extracellular solute-binding protein [Nitrososphaerota archaeon]